MVVGASPVDQQHDIARLQVRQQKAARSVRCGLFAANFQGNPGQRHTVEGQDLARERRHTRLGAIRRQGLPRGRRPVGVPVAVRPWCSSCFWIRQPIVRTSTTGYRSRREKENPTTVVLEVVKLKIITGARFPFGASDSVHASVIMSQMPGANGESRLQ